MKFLLSASALLLFSASAFSSTTFQVQVGNILDSSGANVAAGTVGVLMISTTDANFAGSSNYADLVGLQLTAGQAVGDDIIAAVFQAGDLGGVIGFGDLVTVNYTGNISQNDQLALLWFPGVTSTGAVLGAAQSEYGFFRSDSVSANSGGDTSFVLPADTGAALTLAYFDSGVAAGSGVAPGDLRAQGVPEPSRAVLAGLGLLGLFFRRRR